MGVVKFEDLDIYAQRDLLLEKVADQQVIIANLRNDITMRDKAQFVGLLMREYKMTGGPANVMGALYAARGKPLGHSDIHMSIPRVGRRVDRDDTVMTLVKVYVHHIRAATEPGAIIAYRNAGYSLSPEWVMKLDRLITPVDNDFEETRI